MLKEKKCKGTHRFTYGLGCGRLVPSEKRKFGLANDGGCDCWKEWLKSDASNDFLNTSIIPKAKKEVAKKSKKESREKREKQKLDLISPDKYRAKYVQPLINKIARLIDYGQPCIATGNFEGKMAGGHYTSVGSNRTICLNLHNIFKQSFHSNSWNGGDDKKYRESLINTFGEDYLDFIESLKRHRPIKLTKEELVVIKNTALAIIKDLERNETVLTHKERISMRNTINIELGIYEPEFSVFNG